MKLSKLNDIIDENIYKSVDDLLVCELKDCRDAGELMGELLQYFADGKHADQVYELLAKFVDEYARENF